jgi:hypothetical protein
LQSGFGGATLRSLDAKRLDQNGSTADAKLPDTTGQAILLEHKLDDQNEEGATFALDM